MFERDVDAEAFPKAKADGIYACGRPLRVNAVYEVAACHEAPIDNQNPEKPVKSMTCENHNSEFAKIANEDLPELQFQIVKTTMQ